MRNTTSHPDRRASRSMSSPASSFLAPWFSTPSTRFTASLDLVSTSTSIGKLAHKSLVHQRFTGWSFEDIGRQLDRIYHLTFHILYFNFHRTLRSDTFCPIVCSHLYLCTRIHALRACLTTTMDPLLPGTAPHTPSKLRSPSTRPTLRFWEVRRWTPMCPGIFFPLRTRPGVVVAPIEPGERWRSDWP